MSTLANIAPDLPRYINRVHTQPGTSSSIGHHKHTSTQHHHFVSILTKTLNSTSYLSQHFKTSDLCPSCGIPDCTVWPGEKKNEEEEKKKEEEEEKKREAESK